MKDLVQIWNRVTGRQYAAVNTEDRDRELRVLADDRSAAPCRYVDVDATTFESNAVECEALNSRFDHEDFSGRREAIISRLFERRKKGQLARQPKCLFLMLMLGFFALGAGCFILFVHPYDILFRLKVVLADGGEIFEMWRKPEVDLYTRVFLFNVTNAEAYMSGDEDTLKFQEVGPYVYKEILEHTDVVFNPNKTLSAVPKHPLQWVDELSEGHKEDDMLYLPHIALLSIANVVAKQSFMTRFALNNLISLTGSQPLARMTAKEFMMGYKSQLLTLGNQFMPGWIYFDKLGLIDRMYDFEGDYETIYTGEDDLSLSGLIDTYRGSQDLPQWKGRHCSNVQYASDGTKFKGGVTKNESLLFFRKSLCRAAPLIAKEEGVKSGLKGYMYTFPENMLDNGKYIEENKCFCREGKCLPAGLIDVTDCYYGFPIALSYPHFYKGEDVLFNKIEGLTPDKEKHETRFWIQPDSGLPLDVSAKIQINMALEDLTAITNAGRFSNIYLPMLWFDIRMYTLPSSMEERFKLYLNVLPVAEKVAMYSSFVIGAVLLLFTVYRLAFKIMFKSYDEAERSNFGFNINLWIEKETDTRKNDVKDDGEVYSPCEIPLNSSNESSDETVKEERRTNYVKCQGERIMELSARLGENVKGKVKDELTNIKRVFKGHHEKEDCVSSSHSSSSDDCTASDGRFKYLEVVDDDDIVCGNAPRRKSLIDKLKRMNELDSTNRDLIDDTSD